jgi:alkanesulfonate monooxygenase SsuD/methylene tetrahydromethanopterin reductase-like flavin-dependent oxidoreductase (luciferase family)
LKLVARYAQACNLFPGPDLERKLDVLRKHCEDEERSYDDIEKTVLFNFDVGDKGERANEIIESLAELARLGFSVAHGSVVGVSEIDPLDIIGDRIVPVVADL